MQNMSGTKEVSKEENGRAITYVNKGFDSCEVMSHLKFLYTIYNLSQSALSLYVLSVVMLTIIRHALLSVSIYCRPTSSYVRKGLCQRVHLSCSYLCNLNFAFRYVLLTKQFATQDLY